MNILTSLGKGTLTFLRYLGALVNLTKEICYSVFKGQKRWNQFTKQVGEIGFRSQPVIIVTGAFTGAVLAAQSLFQFKMFRLETAAGGLVSVAMLRELGPTITAMMLSGRVGSAMAAEIGTMKVTEQIDALRSMAVHPVDYLVTPRFLAMIVSVPILIAESAAFGILASYLVGVHVFDVNSYYWNANVDNYTELNDIFIAVTKGLIFGVLIVIISCHQGLSASNGAVGVGQGTTRAMVFSSLAVLVVNFFLTLLMQHLFPASIA